MSTQIKFLCNISPPFSSILIPLGSFLWFWNFVSCHNSQKSDIHVEREQYIKPRKMFAFSGLWLQNIFIIINRSCNSLCLLPKGVIMEGRHKHFEDLMLWNWDMTWAVLQSGYLYCSTLYVSIDCYCIASLAQSQIWTNGCMSPSIRCNEEKFGK